MSTVKERPAIMAGHSVRKIFADEKTHTRRVAKGFEKYDHIEPLIWQKDGEFFWRCWNNIGGEWEYEDITCPHGQPGDRLWVKETWLELEMHHWVFPTRSAKKLFRVAKRRPFINSCAYKAECSEESDEIRKQYGYRWKSPMFMPRWASRLTIEIKDIKLERVCSISQEDARKEGYDDINQFFKSWDKLNAKRGFSAESNPWVWVIEFERLKEQN